MVNQSTSNAPVPEIPTGVAEVLLAAYKGQADESRQHEDQRERMTALVAAAGAAVLGFVASRPHAVNRPVVGVALVALGLYGALFSLKHHERSRRHSAVQDGIGDRLAALFPQAELGRIRAEAKARHRSRYRLMAVIPVAALWVGLPLLVSLMGVALLVAR